MMRRLSFLLVWVISRPCCHRCHHIDNLEIALIGYVGNPLDFVLLLLVASEAERRECRMYQVSRVSVVY